MNKRMQHLFAMFCMFATLSFSAAAPIAFVGVNVVPMDQERILAGQTVLVDNGHIVAIGDTAGVAVPENATRINGRGYFLMPGLAEMHAHVPRGGKDLERVLALFLANGVTTMRGMLGAPEHLQLREELASGARPGPRLITSGPSLNGRSVDGAGDARRQVAAQHAAGYDFLKLHPGLTREEFDAIAQTANTLGIPFAGHVSEAVGVVGALEAGQDSIDHLDGYMQALVRDGAAVADLDPGFFGIGLANQVDEKKITRYARHTAAAGVWNVPTQTLIEHFANAETPDALAARPEMIYMSKNTVDSWQRRKTELVSSASFDAETAARAIGVRRTLIKALHSQGAGLLLGSDAPQVFNVPGFSAHEELELLVAAGLTPYEALCTGTVNPAKYFGEEKHRGQVAAGQAADLIFLERNPLSDIRNTRSISGVMIAGRWYDRHALDALLSKYRQRDAAAP